MHVVIDAHLAVRDIDGVTRYLDGILRELPQLDTGIDYTILTLPVNESGLSPEIFNAPNVRRKVVNLHGPAPKQHLMMRKLLKELKADLYHHPQFDLPFGVKIPCVATIHDLKFLFHPEFLKGNRTIKSLYIRQCLKHTLRAADRLIVVSNNTLADLNRLFSFDHSKVTVIHHAADLRPMNADLRSPVLADLPDNFVLFVGTRRPHKNIEGLIRAIEILRLQRGLDIDLVIAGKAYPDYDGPEKLTQTLNLSRHVHFLDFVEDDLLPVLYQKARLFALVSFYEGFGIPLIEAMACGTPVIGANTTSIPEVIGSAGLLVDPHDPVDIADKIHEVHDNETTRNRLSQAGRERAQSFTWNSFAKTTLNVYNNLLSQRHEILRTNHEKA